MKPSKRMLALLLFVLVPVSAYSQSDAFSFERKPRWEAGLGGGYINSVDYPGSTDPNVKQIVLPFFIYRSRLFRFGDGGAGAVAVEQPRLKLDVSLGGSLNADSEAGSVREGFPELDLLFELGPRLQYKLLARQWANGSRSELTIDTKVRAVLATDFEGIRAQGFVLGAGFELRQRAIAGEKVDLIFNTDISFGDQRYNDYLYTVPAEYATPQRPLYEAKPGYVETRAFFGLAFRPVQSLRIFTGVSAFSYANSANEESPLFETTTSTQYAVGVVWTAFSSKNSIDVYKSE